MNDSYNIKEIVKNLVIVLTVVIVFYFITVMVSKNKNKVTNSNDEISVIQYEYILLGNLFDENYDEYYVLIEDKNDNNLTNYKSYISNYQKEDNAIKFLYVDLDSAFNKRYISDDNVFEKNNLHVKGTNLIKIKDKEIVETYSSKDEIMEALKKISG